jgi:5-methylcytosine-specific restriction enzyme B
VFHPEYTYSDFIGKLLPLTYRGYVVYKYYPGDFLQALGMAYQTFIYGTNNIF